MRIVLCPSAFHPSVGGVEEHCRNLAEYLRRDGHEVRIAVNRHPSTLPKAEIFDKLDVERFEFVSPNRSIRALTCLPVIVATICSFLAWLRAYRADVLHVVCPSSNSFYCYIAALILRIPCITSFHGELFMDANQLYQKSAFARWSLKKLLSVSTAVTACSRYVLTDAKTKFVLPSFQTVIYNGIESEVTDNKVEFDLEHKQYLLGVGRLVAQKGFDMLIKSFTPIANTYPNINLVIVGDGPMRENLTSLVKEQGLDKQVTFTGSTNRQQTDAIFEHCRFFVLTSPVEPFGIVCLEAMRSAKPVIAFNAGGPPEFITDGVEGFLVEPSNVHQLTVAIERLLDEGLCLKMGELARLRAATFTWASVSEQYQKIYQQSLQHKAR